MTLSSMTFHESYGNLPKSTLRLIKRFNVSTADYDQILGSLGFTWDYDGIDFSAVNAMIEAGSSSGTYRPSRYL
jgi:hypothetical protein